MKDRPLYPSRMRRLLRFCLDSGPLFLIFLNCSSPAVHAQQARTPPISLARQTAPAYAREQPGALTKEEWFTAKQLGTKEIAHTLGTRERLRICEVELLPGKISLGETSKIRLARVIAYDISTNTGASVIVNLSNKTVQSTEKLEPSEIPMAPEDLTEAKTLALADKKFILEVLQGQAGGYDIDGLLVRTEDSADKCQKDRCIELLVRKGDSYVAGLGITVDLTTRKVEITKQ